jgi:hypothetical protein
MFTGKRNRVIPFHVGHVVVETRRILRGRTIAEVAAVAFLASLSQNMGRRMPVDSLA